jgi:hypothetical protein
MNRVCGAGKTGELNGKTLGTAKVKDVGRALKGLTVGDDVGGNANADMVGETGSSTGVGGNASNAGDGDTDVGAAVNAVPVEEPPRPTPDMAWALAVFVNTNSPPAATTTSPSVLNVIVISPLC